MTKHTGNLQSYPATVCGALLNVKLKTAVRWFE